MLRRWLTPLAAAALAAPLAAQEWDAPVARALVARAIARRAASFADSGLADWSARADGFVFFLGQIGEGLSEPPRLVKADQLALEVFWRAPDRSRQRIIGWRDRRDLPTDINYHRDHLGIVMNNFPDLIRLGEGDEVRDVPHPVSAAGAALYQFAVADSLSITLPDRAIRVYEVRVRPRDFRAPRIVGSLYLDVANADLVRMTFNFTRAAYLDTQLEDIAISVENSLWNGRWWLPLRQEIEIRRRATWMDFPARGIIRGRWEIGGYRFNQGLDPALFRPGPEIVVAPQSVRDTFPWRDSLDAAVRDIARPARLEDFDAIRAEAAAVAMGHVLTGLRQTRIAGGSVSDFVHVNRVEGLAIGAGVTRRSADEAREVRVRAGAATARWLPTGSAEATARRGPWTWRIAGWRSVRDIGDLPVISGLVNSLHAQEGGSDYGDYILVAGGSVGLTRALGGRGALAFEASLQHVDSLTAAADWARGGARRPNPGVDRGDWAVARLSLRRSASSFAADRGLTGRADLEGGLGPSDYVRMFAEGRWQRPLGAGSLVVRAAGGAAAGHLPRHRGFVLGGRGTLLGEPFRAAGGSRMAWLAAEWQLPVRIPELRLGSFAGTGASLTVAPGVAVGWTGGRLPGFFAVPSAGPEPVAGLGVSWLHDLLRVDAGYGLRSGRWGVAADVSRAFWGIL
jgi:hypothetical protein